MSERDEFEAWFEREYPMDSQGGRRKYQNTMVRDLMFAAYQAARAAPQQGVTPLMEPVAIICDGWDIRYVGCEPIAGIVKKHGLKIGSKLYAAPQPSQEETK